MILNNMQEKGEKSTTYAKPPKDKTMFSTAMWNHNNEWSTRV